MANDVKLGSVWEAASKKEWGIRLLFRVTGYSPTMKAWEVTSVRDGSRDIMEPVDIELGFWEELDEGVVEALGLTWVPPKCPTRYERECVI